MKKAILCVALCAASLTLPQKASAGWWDWWNWGNGDNNGGNTGGSGNNVPLDGGLSLLAIAGIGYSVKKVAVARKK